MAQIFVHNFQNTITAVLRLPSEQIYCSAGEIRDLRSEVSQNLENRKYGFSTFEHRIFALLLPLVAMGIFQSWRAHRNTWP